MTGALLVERAGPGATVQDRGRPGLAAWGIGPSGAADRAALRLANRLVGNHEGAAAVEVTLGGLTIVADRAVAVAVTGAPVAVRCASARAGFAVPFVLGAGDRLELGRPEHGVVTYLAVRGGIAAGAVFGSRSTDTLGGLGPPPLSAGTVLVVGEDTAGEEWTIVEPVPHPAPRPTVVAGVVAGPRHDWTDLDRLLGPAFVVRPDSDRVGLRLHGPALPRRVGELPSEGMLRGAVQLPPDGHPIVLGPDHPVTGGYPVVAVVADTDLDALAQLRPGDRVRFRLRRDLPSW